MNCVFQQYLPASSKLPKEIHISAQQNLDAWMNAFGLLKQQGWRGEGFSLDATNRGIAKPLLIQHKTDASGLGIKKNDFAGQGQWWLNAFDTSLKDWAVGKKPAKINPRSQRQSGLYSTFVKAKTLQGTFTPPSETTSRSPNSSSDQGSLEATTPSTEPEPVLEEAVDTTIELDKKARKAARASKKALDRLAEEEASQNLKLREKKRKRKHSEHATAEVMEQDIKVNADKAGGKHAREEKKARKRRRKEERRLDKKQKAIRRAAKLERRAKKEAKLTERKKTKVQGEK